MVKDGALTIRNVHLPSSYHDPSHQDSTLFDVLCEDGRIKSIIKAEVSGRPIRSRVWFSLHVVGLSILLSPREIDAEGKGILLPSLCHSHIHLDKCFLLNQGGDLKTGTFQEALEVTSAAKARFVHDDTDLYERGKRLMTESILAGVTSMRAFVEIDRIVSMHCLDIGLRLKKEFTKECEIQLVVFAQDPLFDDPSATEPGDNYRLLAEAAATQGVSVVGSAPYVEPSLDQAKRNIKLVLDLAKEGGLHVDFHLDYNLNSSAQPLIYDVIKYMGEIQWTSHFSRDSMRQVTIGHGTRYSLFDDQEWRNLKESIGDLPISFVALPQSDLYMMGKAHPRSAKLAPRGTIPVPFVADLGLDIALSVNNVENAFTPQGSVDPLPLCSLGVAIYQDASERTCQILLDSVSNSSKRNIGIPSSDMKPGDPADFVLLHSNTSVRSAVLDPRFDRTTIRAGNIVSSRRSSQTFGPVTRPPTLTQSFLGAAAVGYVVFLALQKYCSEAR